MTWFVIIGVGMTALALAWVLPPLMRERKSDDGIARPASNLAVLRDELAELDADLRNGVIAPDQYDRARAELERRVLNETAEEPQAGPRLRSGRWTAALLGVLLPVCALLFYLRTGSPDALAPEKVHGDAEVSAEQIEQMVSRLAARLSTNPDDPNGWALLGRSYYMLGRYGEAVKTYARAIELNSEDAGLYADYADALAMTQGRRIDDQVLVLINQALKLDPNHIKALVLASTAAFERKDYRGAVTYLERLQGQVPADTKLGGMLGQRLEEARAHVSGQSEAQVATAPPPAGLTVKGRVSLSPALASRVAATDTVFILARAPEGPRMPLAVLKRQVKDLPVEFILSDEQAMTPQMKLSKFGEVVVVARVSKAGSATPQSGDLQGMTGAVKVGAAGVTIVIDSVVP